MVRTTDQQASWRAFCADLFEAAIRPVLPASCLPQHLPDPTGFSGVKLVAIGKGAAEMARVVEEAWPEVRLEGVAICRYGQNSPCSRIDVIEAAHPVPDHNSVLAAERALAVAQSAASDQLLLVLLSGGGSSLACSPAEGLTLQEKQRVTRDLMHAGADIVALNTVRKHLSGIKGGRLAEAGKRAGKLVTLAISDVVGDDPGLIASGPTWPDKSTQADALAVLNRFAIEPPNAWAPACKEPPFAKCDYQIVASASEMLAAARQKGEAAGFDVECLGATVIGEAREVARNHAAVVRKRLETGRDHPVMFLSGGELTSKVKGTGEGGPNQEYVLALAAEFGPEDPVYAFAADTDGMDGIGGAAGAMTSPDAREAAVSLKLDPLAVLERSDSMSYFRDLGDSFQINPTQTNVNDLRIVVVAPRGLPSA